MTYDWIPGAALALVGSGLGYWRSTAVSDAVIELKVSGLEKALDEKVGGLREDHGRDLEGIRREMGLIREAHEKIEATLGTDLKEACRELRAVVENFRAMSAEQSVINDFTRKALESVVNKSESHDKSISEVASTVGLIREWLGNNR
jgi:hypothetical protein